MPSDAFCFEMKLHEHGFYGAAADAATRAASEPSPLRHS
jgi:hypothetical protein